MEAIKNLELPSPYLLAPMAGVTDAGMRKLAGEFGAGLVYTEMISVNGLLRNGKKTERLLLSAPGAGKTAVQLFGATPEHFRDAVQNPLLAGFGLIDINMGCPVPKVSRNGAGAALMKDIRTAEKIIRAAAENTKRPVTVKFRLGWESFGLNYLEFARMAEGAGAAAVALHARTKEQGYAGRADWEKIGEVRRALKIPVIANGDITDRESLSACAEITGCKLFMIGRAAIGRPWIFSELSGTPRTVNKFAVIKEHIETLLSLGNASGAVINYMRHHLSRYVRGEPDARPLRDRLVRITDIDALYEALSALNREISI